MRRRGLRTALRVEYLALPSQHLIDLIRTLARQYRMCIVGTIIHSPLTSPVSSPFIHLLDPKKPQHITPAQLEWAKYLQSHLASSEETAHPGLLNTAFFVDKDGEVKGEYVKRSLWVPERYVAGAGPCLQGGCAEGAGRG